METDFLIHFCIVDAPATAKTDHFENGVLWKHISEDAILVFSNLSG